jgi:hypothetical protein
MKKEIEKLTGNAKKFALAIFDKMNFQDLYNALTQKAAPEDDLKRWQISDPEWRSALRAVASDKSNNFSKSAASI